MSYQNHVKVMIATAHELVEVALVMALETEMEIEVVGAASIAGALVATYEMCQPHVLLVDGQMPGMEELTLIATIRHKYPLLHIIVLTSSPDEMVSEKALQAGVTSYLEKTGSLAEIVTAIHAAMQGAAT